MCCTPLSLERGELPPLRAGPGGGRGCAGDHPLLPRQPRAPAAVLADLSARFSRRGDVAGAGARPSGRVRGRGRLPGLRVRSRPAEPDHREPQPHAGPPGGVSIVRAGLQPGRRRAGQGLHDRGRARRRRIRVRDLDAAPGRGRLHAAQHTQRIGPGPMWLQGRGQLARVSAHRWPVGGPRAHGDRQPELERSGALNLPPPTDLAVAALRWLEYAGLLGFVGVVVVRRLAAMRPAITWARPSMQPALAAAFVGGLAVVSIDAVRLGHPSVSGIVRVAAEGVALGLCIRGYPLVVPPGILAAAALAFAGHAAMINPPAGAIFQRFGRVAFLAFTITALTGVLRASEELRGFDDLWGTPYGLVLSLKTAGVLVMVAMSVVVWRRGFQHARAEGALVLIVLAATAMLAAFPMPPGQA